MSNYLCGLHAPDWSNEVHHKTKEQSIASYKVHNTDHYKKYNDDSSLVTSEMRSNDWMVDTRIDPPFPIRHKEFELHAPMT